MSGLLLGVRVLPPSMPLLAVAGRELAHVVGKGLGLPFGVLSSPEGEVVEEAPDLLNRPVEAAYNEVAGMTDTPAAEVGDMIVVLLEPRRAPAQWARLVLSGIKTQLAFL